HEKHVIPVIYSPCVIHLYTSYTRKTGMFTGGREAPCFFIPAKPSKYTPFHADGIRALFIPVHPL
ncbi:MAG TPA: hypothetical protein VFV37_04610, partial [Luteibaculaceae bacterium]|nr:hypothetical protein [Luteibaculaceae bacterium]